MIKLKHLLQEQTTVLRKGSRGEQVKKLQKQLIQLKYLPSKLASGNSSADGIFGSGTKAAVQKFQKDNKLSADGIVGKNTYSMLQTKLTSSPKVNITKQYIEALHKTTRGTGTNEVGFFKIVKNIKDKNILNQINKVLQSNQKLYDQYPPNSMITLSDGSRVNSDWLKGYTSIQAIIDGELGILDQTVKNKLNYHLKTLKDPKSLSDTGWAIGLSWPTYQPSLPASVKQGMKVFDVDKIYNTIGKTIYGDDFKSGTLGPQGHGGIAIIDPAGNVYLAEFGRYTSGKSMQDGKKWFLTQPEGRKFAKAFQEKEGRPVTIDDIPADAVAGYGVVQKKSLGRIAKIENGEITNFDSVLKRVKSNSQGKGPKLPMQGVLVRGYDYKTGLQFINSFTTREYTLVDIGTGGGSNCATFMVDTMIAGKIPGLQGSCFPNINANFKAVADSPNVVTIGSA